MASSAWSPSAVAKWPKPEHTTTEAWTWLAKPVSRVGCALALEGLAAVAVREHDGRAARAVRRCRHDAQAVAGPRHRMGIRRRRPGRPGPDHAPRHRDDRRGGSCRARPRCRRPAGSHHRYRHHTAALDAGEQRPSFLTSHRSPRRRVGTAPPHRPPPARPHRRETRRGVPLLNTTTRV